MDSISGDLFLNLRAKATHLMQPIAAFLCKNSKQFMFFCLLLLLSFE